MGNEMSANRDEKKEMEKQLSSDEGDSGGEDHATWVTKAGKIGTVHNGPIKHQENHYHMTKDLKKLSPLSGGEHMQERRKRGFCGRSWVYAEMRAWFLLSVSGDGEEGSAPVGKYKGKPVLLVTGGPGVGKSALAAQLEGDGSDEFRMCAALGGRLLAVHSIQVYDKNSKNASAFVKGITGAFLRFCVKKKIMGTKQFETELEHKSEDAHVRWCHLMEWMRKVELEDPLIVVVNGLDEGESERSQSIASVLGRMQHAKLVPEWLRVVAFTRPHKNVLAYFNRCYDEIDLESEVFYDLVSKDVEEFVSNCGLSNVKEKTLAKMGQAARGNFLVLSCLKRSLKESEKDGEKLLEELTRRSAHQSSEDDLVFILHYSFERFVKRSVGADEKYGLDDEVLQKAYSPFVPLLSVLVAAEGKLTDEQLFQAVRVVEPGLSFDEHEARLEEVGWLLAKDSHGRRSFFHGYMAEWLRCVDGNAGTRRGIKEDASNTYRVYAEDGHALLAAWGLLLCGGGAWKDEEYGGHRGLKEKEERRKLEKMVGRWIAGRKLEKEDEKDSSDDEGDCRPTRLVLYEKKVASCESLVQWECKDIRRPTYFGSTVCLDSVVVGLDVIAACVKSVVHSRRYNVEARSSLLKCVFQEPFVRENECVMVQPYAEHGDLEGVQLSLLVDKRMAWGEWYLLHRVAGSGYGNIVAWLVKQKDLVDVNAPDETQGTALMAAAAGGFTEVVSDLLDSDCKPDLQDKNGFCALMFAVDGGYEVTAKVLVKNWANINMQDKEGLTVLMHVIGATIASGNMSVLEWFLRLDGLDLEAIEEHKSTAIGWMIKEQWNVMRGTKSRSCCLQCIEVFKDAGAAWVLNMKTEGHRALYNALFYGMKEITRALSPLIEPHVEDEEGHTAVWWMVEMLKEEDIQLFKDILEDGHWKGATIEDEDGHTAVMRSITNRKPQMLKALLEKMSEGNPDGINYQTKDRGFTALIHAAVWGNLPAVKVLMKHGADTSLKDHEQRTALQWAMKNGRDEIKDFLERKGAKE